VGRVALPELAIASMGLTDLLLILLIVVVLFGATRLSGSDRPSDGGSTTSRWSRTDWILLLAAVVSCGVALALPALRR
jgi:hypothetical protein